MGALEIRNKKLRCTRCLDIRRLLIIPSVKKPRIEIMCHCNKSVENFLEFCNEINKVTDIKLKCSKCGRELIKHPRLCYDCLLVYCSKCCDNHLPRKDNDDVPIRASLVGHTTIHIEKLDYYCVDHQNDSFIGYCKECLMNLCNECIKEGTHKSHHVDIFSVIEPNKKEKDNIKNGIKKAENKNERNNKKITSFCKAHIDDDRTKEIEEKYKLISEENNDIIALLKYCLNLYKSSKLKNYSIIYNLIKNNKFNNKKFELEKASNEEEKYEMIFKYLKKDALILCKRSKVNKEKFELDDNKEQEDESEEEIKEEEENPIKNFKISSNINNELYVSDSKENKNENDNNYEEDLYENADDDDNNNNIYQENKKEENLNINQIINVNNKNKSNINEKNSQNKNNIQPKKFVMPTIFVQTKDQKTVITSKDVPRPKKLKMPSMFEKHEEEKKPEKPLPAKFNLKMPSIFEKKEEDNKSKEKPGIINTGAVGNMGMKKDFLAQMMEKKKEMGMGIGGGTSGDNNYKMNKENPSENSHNKERTEIIQVSTEGNTEEVINKVVVMNKKKKKPKRAKAFGFGEEFIELPKPQPKPQEENNEIKEQNENIENNENNEKKEINENINNENVNNNEINENKNIEEINQEEQKQEEKNLGTKTNRRVNRVK